MVQKQYMCFYVFKKHLKCGWNSPICISNCLATKWTCETFLQVQCLTQISRPGKSQLSLWVLWHLKKVESRYWIQNLSTFYEFFLASEELLEKALTHIFLFLLIELRRRSTTAFRFSSANLRFSCTMKLCTPFFRCNSYVYYIGIYNREYNLKQ